MKGDAADILGDQVVAELAACEVRATIWVDVVPDGGYRLRIKHAHGEDELFADDGVAMLAQIPAYATAWIERNAVAVMEEMDSWEPQWRALAHEYGYDAVKPHYQPGTYTGAAECVLMAAREAKAREKMNEIRDCGSAVDRAVAVRRRAAGLGSGAFA